MPRALPTPTRDEVLLRLTDRGAVFGLVLENGIVVRAAPMGRWLIGRTEDEVRRLCRPRRIAVEVVSALD